MLRMDGIQQQGIKGTRSEGGVTLHGSQRQGRSAEAARAQNLYVTRNPRHGSFSDSPIPARGVVAIPAHNEEVGIGSVVIRALEHADEVVVVDDGSSDATVKVAERAGARVIRHEVNGGYGAALRTIFETARRENWPALTIIDSDGQHNPSDIPHVVRPILEGHADVCIGSRFLDKADRETMPVYREFGIRILTELSNIGADSHQRVTDGQCGFRSYSRRAIEAIDPGDPDMGTSAEILFQARKAGLVFAEVPVKVRYDVDGSSQHPVKHGLGVMRSIARFAQIDHPLVFFGAPGFLSLVAGALLLAITAAAFVTQSAISVAAGASSIVLVLVGVLSLNTGLTLHAVKLGTKAR